MDRGSMVLRCVYIRNLVPYINDNYSLIFFLGDAGAPLRQGGGAVPWHIWHHG